VLGLDTNVLARFLLDDDASQNRRANRVIAASRERGEQLFISLATTLELEWTLRSNARSRADIVDGFELLLDARGLSFEDPLALEQALEDFSASSVDFGECLFHAIYERSGCSSMLTFDKRAAKQLPRCTLL
jgi:predicted nucleic-acid-binding protein